VRRPGLFRGEGGDRSSGCRIAVQRRRHPGRLAPVLQLDQVFHLLGLSLRDGAVVVGDQCGLAGQFGQNPVVPGGLWAIVVVRSGWCCLVRAPHSEIVSSPTDIDADTALTYPQLEVRSGDWRRELHHRR